MGAGAVLAAWERAADVDGARRAAVLAGCVEPADDPALLPLGRRDAALLRLYRDLRGPIVETLATCPGCGSTLDVHLSVAELVAGYDDEASEPVAEFFVGTTRVRARRPTTDDLLAVARCPDIETAALELVRRCVESVERADGSHDDLDDEERAALGACLEVIDPLVDTRIDIACGDCGQTWSAFLDVPDLAWSQVSGRARRLLREVDALAARYGWSEEQILALTESRRHAYLELE